MEIELPLCRLGRKIGCFVVDAQRHRRASVCWIRPAAHRRGSAKTSRLAGLFLTGAGTDAKHGAAAQPAQAEAIGLAVNPPWSAALVLLGTEVYSRCRFRGERAHPARLPR